MPEREIPLEEEIRMDYERLRIAYLFNRNMGTTRNEQELVTYVLRFAFDLLPADRGAVLLRDDDGAPLRPSVTYRRDEDREPQASGDIVIPDSILRRAIGERTAVLSGDAAQDLRFEGSESVIREHIRSAMCVPLVGQNDVFGAIHLDTTEARSAFSVKDLRILSMVASQAAPVLERYRLLDRLEKEAATRERLSRFLAPQVLEEVVERGMDLAGGGQTGRVTILFCDIRGFSALAESEDPTQLVRMLNAYFEQMVEVIFRHGGLLDKFIGDAVMAVWGAPIRREDDAARAVQAGRDILEAVESFNDASRARGWPTLRVGVGLNTGEAVIGTVGSSLRMEYTVMGDAVNLAARICNLAQGGQMLLSEATLEECRKGGGSPLDVRERPPGQVRGRKAPVQIFEFAGGKC
jgi:adenylate cyclase